MLALVSESLDDVEIAVNPFTLSLSDTHFICRFVVGDEVKPESGERYYFGFSVLNSEVGAAKVVIQAFIFRLVCANGLITAVDRECVFEKIHKGLLTGEILETMSEKINHILKAGPEVIDMVENSRGIFVQSHPAIKSILENAGMGKKAVESAMESALLPEKTTTFDVIDFTTSLAHSQDIPGSLQHDI